MILAVLYNLNPHSRIESRFINTVPKQEQPIFLLSGHLVMAFLTLGFFVGTTVTVCVRSLFNHFVPSGKRNFEDIDPDSEGSNSPRATTKLAAKSEAQKANLDKQTALDTKLQCLYLELEMIRSLMDDTLVGMGIESEPIPWNRQPNSLTILVTPEALEGRETSSWAGKGVVGVLDPQQLFRPSRWITGGETS